MAFFSKSFTEAAAPKEQDTTSRDSYVNPSSIGKTLPNPFRFSILSEEPLEGYEVWFDKADGTKTKRISAGDRPSSEVLAEYEKQIGATVAFEVDFETKQPTDRLAIKQCAAFFIYDYDAKAVKVLSYTQRALLDSIARKTGDPDYEDLSAWDFEITKVMGPRISYEVAVKPALRAKDKAVGAELDKAWADALAKGANIWRLTDGGNPFAEKA
jgi:hypothetical protein